ncbi:MAG: hypothetical protein OSB65_18330 [Roseibacillus sp.]|nr:hypothetical protein [Roseibacillus sp.]
MEIGSLGAAADVVLGGNGTGADGDRVNELGSDADYTPTYPGS